MLSTAKSVTEKQNAGLVNLENGTVEERRLNSVFSDLTTATGAMPLGTARCDAPDGPGLYSIFVVSPEALPAPYSDELVVRSTRLLYVGKASRSLKRRLLEEDLLGKRNSTFFRAIGAILGHRPPRGSLRGKSNQNNYRFRTNDRRMIVEWINCHVRVRWRESERVDLEPRLIMKLQPILNTQYNPRPSQHLARLRQECREIARA